MGPDTEIGPVVLVAATVVIHVHGNGSLKLWNLRVHRRLRLENPKLVKEHLRQEENVISC